MDNFYIKLHKGAGTPFYKKKTVPEYKEFFKGKTLNGNDVEDFALGYDKFDPELIKSLWFRQLVHAKSLCKNFPQRTIAEANFQALDAIANEKAALFEEQGLVDFRVNWRLAIGLGNASVFENSLTLHHVYGIPYIPATSVKGIIRSWLIQEYFSYDQDGNKRPESGEGIALRDSEDFGLIFGTPSEFEIQTGNPPMKSRIKDSEGKPTAHIGNMVFFDAFPVKNPKIFVDIMNPHYPEYYKEGSDKPPADWQNPVPIFFLTIKDTDFQFLFGIRRGCTDDECKRLSHVSFEHPGNPRMNKQGAAEKVLKELLEEALGFVGAGAKTATGYGRMKNVSRGQLERIKERKTEEEAKAAEQKAVEEEKRRIAEEAAKREKDLANKQRQNALEKERIRETYMADGLSSKLSNTLDFDAGKEIVAEYKRIVGDIPESEYPAIYSFVRDCYRATISKKRWIKKGKGHWKIIRSWTSTEIAHVWYDEIVGA